jgi:hypothetical protein
LKTVTDAEYESLVAICLARAVGDLADCVFPAVLAAEAILPQSIES